MEDILFLLRVSWNIYITEIFAIIIKERQRHRELSRTQGCLRAPVEAIRLVERSSNRDNRRRCHAQAFSTIIEKYRL